MLPVESTFELSERFHNALPRRIRRYLNERGLSDKTIDDNLIGWNGARITIPVMAHNRTFGAFRLAKDPADRSDNPKMLTGSGGKADLYGRETIFNQPKSLIICEGEFDRLVLEDRGFAAVTSTAGAGTFKREWAEALAGIPNIYICFDNDEPGRQGARHVASLLPQAKVVTLPEEVGPKGDVTDYFVRLGKSRADFLELLRSARQVFSTTKGVVQIGEIIAKAHTELERLKAQVPIEWWIGQTIPLKRNGDNLVGRCPFHNDTNPSFVVYPKGRNYFCFGCRTTGDVLDFIAKRENLTFGEALNRLRRIAAQNHYDEREIA